MTNFVKVLPQKFDVTKLIVAMHQVVQMVGYPVNNMISLTCSPEEMGKDLIDKAHGGATFQSRVEGKMVRHDSWFTEFIPEFEHTHFKEVWDQLNDIIDGGACRMRIMKCAPKGCLSFHEDFDIRYHIPIQTNSRSFFWINESGEFPIPANDDHRLPGLVAYHLPANGSLYRVETMVHHTVYNGDQTDRIHIICSGRTDTGRLDTRYSGCYDCAPKE